MVLTWMLAVALPLQGYAVHAMTACGPSHHPGQGAAHEAPRHHDEVAQADAHGGHAHADAVAGAPDEVAQPGKAGHADKCSACASCCHLAAMASTVIRVGVVPQHPVAIATTPIAHDRVMLGGLDRPPRSLRA